MAALRMLSNHVLLRPLPAGEVVMTSWSFPIPITPGPEVRLVTLPAFARGTIAEVGPGKYAPALIAMQWDDPDVDPDMMGRELMEPTVEPGAVAVYRTVRAEPLHHNGVDYVVVPETDIVAVEAESAEEPS